MEKSHGKLSCRSNNRNEDRKTDIAIVRERRLDDRRTGREPRGPWRINRYGYFGISVAIRDHSMLPFQCSAHPSVKVAKMRRDGVSSAKGCEQTASVTIPRWLGKANRDVNFDTPGISPGESRGNRGNNKRVYRFGTPERFNPLFYEYRVDIFWALPLTIHRSSTELCFDFANCD